MAKRKQKVTQRRKLANQETLRQPRWVALWGCESLLLPAEIVALVTQIHAGTCAALKPETHYGAIRERDHNGGLA